MTGRILVVGSLNMDLVVRVSRLPQPGETVRAGEFHTYSGGKGANQAVAAARLGGRVKLIGRVGADANGQALVKALAQDGVDTKHILYDSDSPTGTALISVDQQGQNTIVVVPGANGRLSPEDISKSESAFGQAAALLLQLECPLPAVARAIELAKKHDLQVILNPAPAQSLDALPLSDVDYLIPNQTELVSLSGLEAGTALEAAALKLRERGADRIIVTLGEEGVWGTEHGVEFRVPARRVLAVDATAAGDAFVGAFAIALVEGHSTRQAAEWGNAAGALAVTKPGAQSSLPHRSELEQFLSEASRPNPGPAATGSGSRFPPR